MLRGCSLHSARPLPQTQQLSLAAAVSPCNVHSFERGAHSHSDLVSGFRLQQSKTPSARASPASTAPEEATRASTASTASSAEAMPQDGRPAQHGRSRSGLLVTKEVLADKLSDSGRVRACPLRSVLHAEPCSTRAPSAASDNVDRCPGTSKLWWHWASSHALCWSAFQVYQDRRQGLRAWRGHAGRIHGV